MSNQTQSDFMIDSVRKEFEQVLRKHIRRLAGVTHELSNIFFSLDLFTLTCTILLVERDKEIKQDSGINKYTEATILEDLADLGLKNEKSLKRTLQVMIPRGYFFENENGEISAQDLALKLSDLLDYIFPKMPGLNIIAYFNQILEEVLTDRKTTKLAVAQIDKTLQTQGRSKVKTKNKSKGQSRLKKAKAPIAAIQSSSKKRVSKFFQKIKNLKEQKDTSKKIIMSSSGSIVNNDDSSPKIKENNEKAQISEDKSSLIENSEKIISSEESSSSISDTKQDNESAKTPIQSVNEDKKLKQNSEDSSLYNNIINDIVSQDIDNNKTQDSIEYAMTPTDAENIFEDPQKFADFCFSSNGNDASDIMDQCLSNLNENKNQIANNVKDEEKSFETTKVNGADKLNIKNSEVIDDENDDENAFTDDFEQNNFFNDSDFIQSKESSEHQKTNELNNNLSIEQDISGTEITNVNFEKDNLEMISQEQTESNSEKSEITNEKKSENELTESFEIDESEEPKKYIEKQDQGYQHKDNIQESYSKDNAFDNNKINQSTIKRSEDNVNPECICPFCGKQSILEMEAEKNKFYYACSDIQCKFFSWEKPYASQCPDCGNPFLIQRKEKGRIVYRCPIVSCSYFYIDTSIPYEEDNEDDEKNQEDFINEDKNKKKRRKVLRKVLVRKR